ncbi:hypothetical protein JL100_034645 (plasmid) [Skermanella mucosa]|uniref:hypothetical protein n=1 Tax=Skermanella mucosa TaxID=1789672 RepID=UPI001E48CF64|nr:hypothetical protein [Skermanella mucosa]UEM24879.1 hypothetical protein JL100_034645 [Skermanella mucosa]
MLFIGGLGGCSAVGYAKALNPELFGMERIAEGIYVDSSMSDEVRRALVTNVAEARSRIAEVYGAAVSTPDIVACSTQSCFESFGGGRQRALAFGDRMLLSPRGSTVHMVSHEWSHTELSARLGWLTRWVLGDLPSWFDEGLAVAVSGEPMHSEEVWRTVERRALPRPELTELMSNGDWSRAVVRYGDVQAAIEGNPDHPMVVYPMVGHEVRGWLARNGRAGLLALIERLRNGDRFDAAYRQPLPS